MHHDKCLRVIVTTIINYWCHNSGITTSNVNVSQFAWTDSHIQQCAVFVHVSCVFKLICVDAQCGVWKNTVSYLLHGCWRVKNGDAKCWWNEVIDSYNCFKIHITCLYVYNPRIKLDNKVLEKNIITLMKVRRFLHTTAGWSGFESIITVQTYVLYKYMIYDRPYELWWYEHA